MPRRVCRADLRVLLTLKKPDKITPPIAVSFDANALASPVGSIHSAYIPSIGSITSERPARLGR